MKAPKKEEKGNVWQEIGGPGGMYASIARGRLLAVPCPAQKLKEEIVDKVFLPISNSIKLFFSK